MLDRLPWRLLVAGREGAASRDPALIRSGGCISSHRAIAGGWSGSCPSGRGDASACASKLRRVEILSALPPRRRAPVVCVGRRRPRSRCPAPSGPRRSSPPRDWAAERDIDVPSDVPSESRAPSSALAWEIGASFRSRLLDRVARAPGQERSPGGGGSGFGNRRKRGETRGIVGDLPPLEPPIKPQCFVCDVALLGARLALSSRVKMTKILEAKLPRELSGTPSGTPSGTAFLQSSPMPTPYSSGVPVVPDQGSYIWERGRG